jgi:methylated-DNA-[protein]-cysteine S-methyltransferase
MHESRLLDDPSVSYSYLPTPIGPLLLVGAADALAEVHFAGMSDAPEPAPSWREDETPFGEARCQLTEYFEGNRRSFDLPLAPAGTPFQLAVWSALRTIAYGEAVSYRDIAEQIGRPTATRAVGAANGRNPLPVIVPCHRVIGTNGTLTGFGGGLDRKAWLLRHEGYSEGVSTRRSASSSATAAPTLPFPSPAMADATS